MCISSMIGYRLLMQEVDATEGSRRNLGCMQPSRWFTSYADQLSLLALSVFGASPAAALGLCTAPSASAAVDRLRASSPCKQTHGVNIRREEDGDRTR